MASVFEEKGCSKFHKIKKRIYEGVNYPKTTQEVITKCSALKRCPKIEMDVSISQLFIVFLASFKTMCLKKWHTFSGFLPTSLSYNANATSYPPNSRSRPYSNTQRLYWREQTINFKREILQNSLQSLTTMPSNSASLCLMEKAGEHLPLSPSPP